MISRRRLWVAIGFVSLLARHGGDAHGQGFLVDRRPHFPVARTFTVEEITLNARVRDQTAEVQISQVFHNPGSVQAESEFLFPLPEDGAIQNFVLLVDGKEMPGRLLPKDEARRIYEEIVRSKQDPALMEFVGRGLYRTSVFPIPPGASRRVTMRYNQVCKREGDVVEFAYPFGSSQMGDKPVQKFRVDVRIESRDAIKSVYSPTYDTTINRPNDHEATARFDRFDARPSGDFRLLYTLAEGNVGASVLSYRPERDEDGYFLLMASPRVKMPDVRPRPKSVVFVLDRSGSMAGKKIEQARNALKFVLNNLREGDTFNIVVYDDRVETFEPELQRYDAEHRSRAERFIENIREGGSTNIDAALKTAVAMFPDRSRPGYVIFLTDGLPTAGTTAENAIAEGCRVANRSHARIFSFGVGYDVNARLLDRLSGGNGGTSTFVTPEEDIEAKVSRFYAKMTSPVLSNIRVELSGVDVNQVYPRDTPDLFDGGQIVLAGRYRSAGPATLRLSGDVGGERKTYEFPVELARGGRGSSHEFVEKLWATRKVGDLIDQIDLHGKSQELIDELVRLSTRYGILTPYTSFLADERVQLHANATNAVRLRRELSQLDTLSGSSGVSQRGMKNDLRLADRSAAGTMQGFDATDAALYSRDKAGSMAGRMGPHAGPGGMMGMGGMGGGMGGMGGGGMGRPMAANVTAAKPSQLQKVRQVGPKTFYWKGNAWVDSRVLPDDEAKAQIIRRFSDAYFRLATELPREAGQYLAIDEPVTVKLGDQTFKIVEAR